MRLVAMTSGSGSGTVAIGDTGTPGLAGAAADPPALGSGHGPSKG